MPRSIATHHRTRSRAQAIPPHANAQKQTTVLTTVGLIAVLMLAWYSVVSALPALH